jgi:integrase
VTVAHGGISLTIPFSKTSLIPTSVAIIRRDDALCPVAAFSAYTSLVPTHLRQPGLPFFLHSTSSATPLSDVTFTRSVRRWVRNYLREPPDDYSGHSFRRGGATAMQLAGVPESTIAAHGRWKSLAYRTYFDVQHSLELRLSATAPLRLQSSSRHRPYELLPRLPPPP